MKKNLDTFELKLKDKKDGVFAISLVENPAIESDFLLFNKEEEPIIFKTNIDQQIITGPALIPNKKILRKNKEDFFQVFMSEETIKDTAIKFFEFNNQKNTTLDHESEVQDTVYFESWIIEDPKNDKSNFLGFKDLTKGTWMVSLKVNNTELWDKIKNGKFYGFSIEGFYNKEIVNNSDLQDKNKGKNMFEKLIQNFKDVIQKFENETIKFLDTKLEDGTLIRIDESTMEVSKIETDGSLTKLSDGNYTLEDGTQFTVKDGIKSELVKQEDIVTLEDGTLIKIDETKVPRKEDGSILADGEYTLIDGTKFTVLNKVIQIASETPIQESENTNNFEKINEIEIEFNKFKEVVEKEKENFEKIKLDFEAEKNILLSEISDLKNKIIELEKEPAVSRTEILTENKEEENLTFSQKYVQNLKKVLNKK